MPGLSRPELPLLPPGFGPWVRAPSCCRERPVFTDHLIIMERAEARRGYAVAAAWDEGAMIQIMARMSNPTLPWQYDDG